MNYILRFKEDAARDVKLVGGKNASLSNMIHDLADKVHIPDGFAITVDAYWYFLKANNITDKIKTLVEQIDIQDQTKLQKNAAEIRSLIMSGAWPDDLRNEVVAAYQALCKEYKQSNIFVAVRSSATAEDLPTASFAGQQESFLYITGDQALLDAAQKCMASLFTDRAIFYRIQNKFNHMKVGLSVGVHKMVEVKEGAAGVAFSLDPETGFKDVVVINGSWGLGELVVQGKVTPDEFVVFKPTYQKGFKPIIKKELGNKRSKLVYNAQQQKVQELQTTEHEFKHFCLTDMAILELSRYVMLIEDYYSKKQHSWAPQDIEWALDAVDGRIYIVQARPETVYSSQKKRLTLDVYRLLDAKPKTLVQGISIGQQIVAGKVVVIRSLDEVSRVKQGDIMVTEMTDPDWIPAMKKATAIITDRGGRTCHAAIVSRELGIPALVGTGDATTVLVAQKEITLDCSQGAVGYVYEGSVSFEKKIVELKNLKKAPVKLLVNIADPNHALSLAHLPVEGVGLARIEFILGNQIGIHPMAIMHPEKLTQEVQHTIAQQASAYASVHDFFVEQLAQGIGMIAAAFYPHEVDVRFSDLKSNEYRNLLGGQFFEPIEENPMLGLRGASRYDHKEYQEGFAMECQAFSRARDVMGFDNIRIMVPFVRTVDEASKVLQLMSEHGLARGGQHKLQTIMAVEIPSNVLLIDQFAQFFDGFSIGSNDLTQLTLGIDRDSAPLAPLFDERNEAVKLLITQAIKGAHKAKRYIGICGQAPSDYPEFAKFLISLGIDSISLNPDAVIPFLL